MTPLRGANRNRVKLITRQRKFARALLQLATHMTDEAYLNFTLENRKTLEKQLRDLAKRHNRLVTKLQKSRRILP